MYYTIYKIENLINGKVYIGQAKHVFKRLSTHRAAAKHNRPTQQVHYAIIKYGIENFSFIAIAMCKTLEDANETETLCVKQYDSYKNGYNATLGGFNAPKTAAWKAIISKKAQERFSSDPKYSESLHKALKNHFDNLTEEERKIQNKKYSETAKMSYAKGRVHPRKGKKFGPMSEEMTQKLSEALKLAYAEGRKVSVAKGKPAWNKGKSMPSPPNKIHFTEEQKQAIAIDIRSCRTIGKDYNVGGHIIERVKREMGVKLPKGNTGKKHSIETKQKISEKKIGQIAGEKNPFYGKSHSEDSLQKNREAHLGKKMSEETKEKIRQSNIGKHSAPRKKLH